MTVIPSCPSFRLLFRRLLMLPLFFEKVYHSRFPLSRHSPFSPFVSDGPSFCTLFLLFLGVVPQDEVWYTVARVPATSREGFPGTATDFYRKTARPESRGRRRLILRQDEGWQRF